MLISSSRTAIYTGKGEDLSDAAAKAAKRAGMRLMQ